MLIQARLIDWPEWLLEINLIKSLISSLSTIWLLNLRMDILKVWVERHLVSRLLNLWVMFMLESSSKRDLLRDLRLSMLSVEIVIISILPSCWIMELLEVMFWMIRLKKFRLRIRFYRKSSLSIRAIKNPKRTKSWSDWFSNKNIISYIILSIFGNWFCFLIDWTNQIDHSWLFGWLMKVDFRIRENLWFWRDWLLVLIFQIWVILRNHLL